MTSEAIKKKNNVDSGRSDWPSVSRLAAPLVQRLIDKADVLRVGVAKTQEGCTLVDAGIDHPGGIEAGLLVTRICLGGLGSVALQTTAAFANWPWAINVHSANPVLACLGSQYAGWSLSSGNFYALGSGPGRALAAREPLFSELDYRDRAPSACLVLEVDKRPPADLIAKISHDCGVEPADLTLILTPTTSLAGSLQVVGRVLEVALHKVHELGFPLARIVDGMGTAPLPPTAGDFLSGMGRTNDAIIYGGTVHLFVAGPDDEAHKLADGLPSRNSRDYGKPFKETFTAYNGDFYAIDGMLFSPARVIVTAVDSGRSFHAGAVDETLVNKSFGYEDA